MTNETPTITTEEIEPVTPTIAFLYVSAVAICMLLVFIFFCFTALLLKGFAEWIKFLF